MTISLSRHIHTSMILRPRRDCISALLHRHGQRQNEIHLALHLSRLGLGSDDHLELWTLIKL